MRPEPTIPAMCPAARRVLAKLIGAGERGATTAELCQPGVGGVRFGARVHELRGLGFRIDAAPVRTGSYRYFFRDNEYSDRVLVALARAA